MAAKLLIAAPVVFVGIASHAAHAHADTGPQEDSASWSCVDDGNRICGPGNANGAPAGRYDAGGVLVESWADVLARCGHSDICLGA